MFVHHRLGAGRVRRARDLLTFAGPPALQQLAVVASRLVVGGRKAARLAATALAFFGAWALRFELEVVPLTKNAPDLWRYLELLPVAPSDPVLDADTGVVYDAEPLGYNEDVQNPKALNAVQPEDMPEGSTLDGPNVFTRPPQVGHFRVWRDGTRR